MSKRMGPLTFGKREESIFLGKEFARHQDYSEATAVQIDDEIKRLVDEAYLGARDILERNRAALEAITEALLEHEVLDGDAISDLISEHSKIDLDSLKKQRDSTTAPEAAESA
jgi:cell division protease FtsH